MPNKKAEIFQKIRPPHLSLRRSYKFNNKIESNHLHHKINASLLLRAIVCNMEVIKRNIKWCIWLGGIRVKPECTFHVLGDNPIAHY